MTGRRSLSKKQKLAEVTQTLTASIADVATDWYYYVTLVDYDGDADLSRFLPLLFIFNIVGSVLAGIVAIALFLNLCGKLSNSWFQRVLALEVLLSDIPQLVLTGLIEAETGGGFSLEGGINLATSAYNMFLDVVSSCRLEELMPDEEEDGGKEQELLEAQAE